jgi:hypothetical protein
MGRGLSELQKQILRIVYEKRQERDFGEEKRNQREMRKDPMHQQMMRLLHGSEDDKPYSVSDYPDISNPELIGALYDWPVSNWYTRIADKQDLRPSEGGQAREHMHNFSRSRIGHEEYNRRTASYYRAVKRLKDRGLLEGHRHGLLITDEGIKMAEDQSVTKSERAAVV